MTPNDNAHEPKMTLGRKVAYAFMKLLHHERRDIWCKVGFRGPSDESTLEHDTAGFAWAKEQGPDKVHELVSLITLKAATHEPQPAPTAEPLPQEQEMQAVCAHCDKQFIDCRCLPNKPLMTRWVPKPLPQERVARSEAKQLPRFKYAHGTDSLKACASCIAEASPAQASAPARDEALTDEQKVAAGLGYWEDEVGELGRRTKRTYQQRFTQPSEADTISAPNDSETEAAFMRWGTIVGLQPWARPIAFEAWKSSRASLQAELAETRANHLEVIEALLGQLAERDVLLTGVGRIAVERARQVSKEGWTPEHDAEHVKGELAIAASCYASPAWSGDPRVKTPAGWPWDVRWWKPSGFDYRWLGLRVPEGVNAEGRIRDLEKAGALIAAEIDRLIRRAALGKGAQG